MQQIISYFIVKIRLPVSHKPITHSVFPTLKSRGGLSAIAIGILAKRFLPNKNAVCAVSHCKSTDNELIVLGNGQACNDHNRLPMSIAAIKETKA